MTLCPPACPRTQRRWCSSSSSSSMSGSVFSMSLSFLRHTQRERVLGGGVRASCSAYRLPPLGTARAATYPCGPRAEIRSPMVCQAASSGARQRVPITLQLAVHREGRRGARDSRLLPEVHPMDSELRVQAPTARYRSSRDIPGRRESVIPWCVKRHRAAPGSGCPSHCGSMSIGKQRRRARRSPSPGSPPA